MTEDDKKLVAAIAMSVSCNVGISPQTLQTAAARIESLSAEVERVTKERDDFSGLFAECQFARDNVGFVGTVAQCIDYLDGERKASEARVRALEEALDFYACIDHYDGGCAPTVVREDKDAKARTALGASND